MQSGTIIFATLRFYGAKSSISESNFEGKKVLSSKANLFFWKNMYSFAENVSAVSVERHE